MPKTPVVIHYLPYFFCLALSVLFITVSVLFIFASLMKQCENFILYLTFKKNFKVNFKQN